MRPCINLAKIWVKIIKDGYTKNTTRPKPIFFVEFDTDRVGLGHKKKAYILHIWIESSISGDPNRLVDNAKDYKPFLTSSMLRFSVGAKSQWL